MADKIDFQNRKLLPTPEEARRIAESQRASARYNPSPKESRECLLIANMMEAYANSKLELVAPGDFEYE